MTETTANTTTNQITRKVAVIGVCSAMALILMYIHFPIKYLGFLEMEFSDVPAVFCGLLFGPAAGVLVELIKNLLKLFGTTTAGVGELANFIMMSCYVLGISISAKKLKGASAIKRYGVSFFVGTIALILAGIAVNYVITFPLYIRLYFGGNEEALVGVAQGTLPNALKGMASSVGKMILLAVPPFNLVKGIIVSIVAYLVYKAVGNRL